MTRADLQDLGELLDSGFAALIVVAAAGLRGAIERAIGHAATIAVRPVAADEERPVRALDEVRAAITATG
ncbi:hypothetical protein E3T26_05265 [Cryobacterium sp. TMT1-21]|uniref:Uncharacterized protein n=1 Tax=Cryobacterium shii TaxID=1259235 RepID=A0AAQ2HGL0_9MICO|nr:MULTISPECIES: hypothetical protein [Cryobacterium]TFC51716.1 hypothetical protein E3O49_03530 [Cryobacterium shii]TFC89416.1 hypothetical protein E3T24_01005 [Cryobacterium sp. TmT2-59]TFD13683.1 hypothetical protein E3T42_13540 [Cryobacterium sp. TMT4-10]TFD15954.1 hypothetical protein E3T26_05265 [Cryobacterium sp. TMT1-21]TFD19802.1 hypothetical protein E3T32_10365 [Cryobacterium sp. TMT2-23]